MNISFLIIQCHDKNFKFYRQLAKATITGATRCFARSRIITTPPALWRWSFSRSTSWTRCKSGSRRFSAMSPISMQDYFYIMNKRLLQTPGWKRCFQIKPEKTYIVFISDCHVRLCSINVFSNSSLPRETFGHLPEPFATSNFNRIYKVCPVKNVYKLNLNWALQPLIKEYATKPLVYLSSVIGHEGKVYLLWQP